MSSRPWYQRRPAELRREQLAVLNTWLRREVRPFNPFWAGRLQGVGVKLTSVDQLNTMMVATEAALAGAGGPGNPALLLSPTEDQFKRHTTRSELVAAAREAAGGGRDGRRNAIWYRYKPVHIHEAGVARLVAIAYTRADLDRLHLAGARLAEVMGWGAEDSLLNLVPAGPSVRYWGLYHAALATRMSALHPRVGTEPVAGAARRGMAVLPASVLAVPTAEAEEALEVLAAGSRLPNLRLVVPVGQPPAAALRTRLAELGARVAGREVRVQAAWAPEISRVLYGEAPVATGDPPDATYGFLTYPDLELVSVRDPGHLTNRDEGQAGELVVTSLGWRGTVVIRAATGSLVGGMEHAGVHPVTKATVPRIAPAAVDGAWQPRVSLGGRSRRVDLRGAARVVRRARERWITQGVELADWSLRVVDSKLVLALAFGAAHRGEDSALGEEGSGPGGEPMRPGDVEVARLVRDLGDTVGAEPEVWFNTRRAAARPQVGDAGVA